MLSRTIRQAAAQAKRQGARMASTKQSSVNGKGSLHSIYNIFMKSTPTYVTEVLIATLVVESVYGATTNYIWEVNNRGRLYHHIDWSKFAEEEEEEEEEVEEDLHDDDEE
ncbi:hypothetical protein PHYBOEH_011241 [Phytophthora boehmeriae]|uniref:Cytochrome b-c1 complex subunit 9 n=1 Tax=Phytophthora boehmeriae TaxID=109152 RepID=A0A8T1X2S9_9STRA|nr:hypothetical protein PHYBOEH_011241 [Phytophthora boehmeriae]